METTHKGSQGALAMLGGDVGFRERSFISKSLGKLSHTPAWSIDKALGGVVLYFIQTVIFSTWEKKHTFG